MNQPPLSEIVAAREAVRHIRRRQNAAPNQTDFVISRQHLDALIDRYCRIETGRLDEPETTEYSYGISETGRIVFQATDDPTIMRLSFGGTVTVVEGTFQQTTSRRGE